MSYDFIQAKFYPKDYEDYEDMFSKRLTMSTDLPEEGQKKVLSNDFHGLILPDYNKNRKVVVIECCINLLKEVSDRLDIAVDHKHKGPPYKTKSGLNEELAIRTRQIANALQWMINITSWSSGEVELFEFDKRELKKSLMFGTDIK